MVVNKQSPGSPDDRVDIAIRLKHGFEEQEETRRRRREGTGLDDVDVAILRALNQNARKSYRDLAAELDIALSTVSARVKRLEDLGIIKGYAPLLDAEKLGFDLVVIVGVKIQHGKLLEVQKRLGRNPQVFEVYDVTGEWDSMLLARFRDREELNSFIKEVSADPGVERTATQLVLNVVKDEKRVLV
ncbi:MAG TPA: Lrp/AsnC family transcriptional regulator [Candidatus Thermoplasmatota archaeon]|nr:Lrp/AsnC family transcriptional regulator [Candidatus Thermoplasmatota archaeon]